MNYQEATADDLDNLLFFSPFTASNLHIKESVLIRNPWGRAQKSVIHNCKLSRIEISTDANQLDLTFTGNTIIDECIINGTPSSFKLQIDKTVQIGKLFYKNYIPDKLEIDFSVSKIIISNETNNPVSEIHVISENASSQIETLEITASANSIKIDRKIKKLKIIGSIINYVALHNTIDNCSIVNSVCQTLRCTGISSDVFAIDASNKFNGDGIELGDTAINTLTVDNRSTYSKFQMIKCKVGKLQFKSSDGSKRQSKRIGLYECSFLKLDMTGYSELQGFELKRSEVKQEFNLEHITFDVKPQSLFEVVNLRKCVLKIYQTKFNNVDFQYVEWPTKNRFYEFQDVRKSRENADELSFKYKNLREGYRTLRKTFYEKGDPFDAMIFQANEVRTQYWIKTIDTYHRGLKSFWNNFADWFLLWSNATFSNFGLSWTRPLCWWLIIHLIFIYVLLSTHELNITPFVDIWRQEIHAIDSEATWEGVNIYLKLLFPVHDSAMTVPFTDTNPPTKVDIWGKTDFSIRLFSSYFLFLVIRGTRKFNFKLGSD